MEPEPILRVGTFNVRNARAYDGWNSWPFRRRATARVTAALGADVLGVQEAYSCQLRYLLKHIPHAQAFGDGRSARRRGEHCSVITTNDITVLEHRTRWFGATPDTPGSRMAGARFPRTATTVVMEHRGTRLSFTNTHLDQRSAKLRRRSAAQLLTWLDSAEPHVIVGDFNAGPADPLFATLSAAGFRHALPVDAGATFHGFAGTQQGHPVDFILVNERFDVVDARIVHSEPGERRASDHWPVTADLRARH